MLVVLFSIMEHFIFFFFIYAFIDSIPLHFPPTRNDKMLDIQNDMRMAEKPKWIAVCYSCLMTLDQKYIWLSMVHLDSPSFIELKDVMDMFGLEALAKISYISISNVFKNNSDSI